MLNNEYLEGVLDGNTCRKGSNVPLINKNQVNGSQ